jgi:hypothetical protein
MITHERMRRNQRDWGWHMGQGTGRRVYNTNYTSSVEDHYWATRGAQNLGGLHLRTLFILLHAFDGRQHVYSRWEEACFPQRPHAAGPRTQLALLGIDGRFLRTPSHRLEPGRSSGGDRQNRSPLHERVVDASSIRGQNSHCSCSAVVDLPHRPVASPQRLRFGGSRTCNPRNATGWMRSTIFHAVSPSRHRYRAHA